MGEVLLRRSYFRYFEVDPGDSVIDIGAHIGTFSLFAWASGAKRVLAFEPSPSNYAALLHNISLNKGCTVEPFNLAVHPTRSTVTLFEHSGKQTDQNSIFGPRSEKYSVKEVPAISLDDILDSNHLEDVDFVKLDAEGIEHELLEKSETLNRVRKLAIESHELKDVPKTNVAELLKSKGFNVIEAPVPESPQTEYVYAWRDSG